jgi:hypothetical protein
VALAGRVPTKVSTENGPIEIGDPLTSSNLPGVAMKAKKPGRIIGLALEPYSGEGVGKIMVFVNTQWYINSDHLLQTEPEEDQGIFASFVEKVKQALSSLGLLIENGIAKIQKMIVGDLEIGSPEQPGGITIYDEITGQPYCIKMSGGALVSLPGECKGQQFGPTPSVSGGSQIEEESQESGDESETEEESVGEEEIQAGEESQTEESKEGESETESLENQQSSEEMVESETEEVEGESETESQLEESSESEGPNQEESISESEEGSSRAEESSSEESSSTKEESSSEEVSS